MGAITDVYRITQKPRDVFWNKYVCRPIAAVLVHLLRATPITPNQITLAALVVALGAAAILLLWPGYFGLLVGVVVFELSYVLDCADGMLARLRSVQSSAGHLLDFLMDELKAFFIFATVAVRLYLASDDARFLLLGLFGLTCLASGIAMTTFLRRPEITGASRAEGEAEPAPATPTRRSPARRVLGLVESAAKFLIHYPSYILYVAIAGRIEVYFYAYIGVNGLYVLRALATVALRYGRFTRPPAPGT